MSFNVVRLSVLQVMMVFGLFSFGKQVLQLFLVQYVDYHVHHVVSIVGHHYCPIACWVAVHTQVCNIMTYNVPDIHMVDWKQVS
jgi:hypothetical protein